MPDDAIRVGLGFDVHAFAAGRRLFLGGVEIPHHLGLAGHSDADVLIHAVIDALTGASGIGSIGDVFPDSDERWRDASSLMMLGMIRTMLAERRILIMNIDTVVVCQEPRIAPHAHTMSRAMADALGIEADRICVKGKTTEGLGFTGRREGIAAYAVALVRKK